MIAGDFNSTRSASERSRYSDGTQRSADIFSSWIDRMDLVDLGFDGPKFTWSSGNSLSTWKAARLDRALCNEDWRLRFADASIHHLLAPYSDHLPILIRLAGVFASIPINRPFRFQAAWLLHEGFEPFIRDNWKLDLALNSALSGLTEDLLVWNKKVFGNIFKKMRSLWNRLEGIKRMMMMSPSNGLIKLERKLARSLNEVLEEEQMLWLQKSRTDFLLDGDRNTRFFHLSTIIRRKVNHVLALKNDDGEWEERPAALESLALEYFANLYSSLNEPSVDTKLNGVSGVSNFVSFMFE